MRCWEDTDWDHGQLHNQQSQLGYCVSSFNSLSIYWFVLVLCSSAVAVEQWIRSYLNFTSCSESTIVRFTKDSKQNLNADGKNILVTTYFMMSYSKKRNIDSARVINQIKNTEWGLLIMDEVHVVPAKMFRKAMVNVKAHCKLGMGGSR